MRVVLVRLDEREHVLLLTLHHIIFDGWSFGICCATLPRSTSDARGQVLAARGTARAVCRLRHVAARVA